MGSCDSTAVQESPVAYFRRQVNNCFEYAGDGKAAGAKIVGIMCEYTPREIIMAAGGIPVCLCGGSREMIEPAETVLPANLCPLIKSTFGYSLLKKNPFLEMADLVVAETTCDGKKKMYELLSRERPMYILELPQKSDDADSFDRWVHELDKFRKELETRFKTDITSEKLKEAIRVMNRERKLKRELSALMKEDDPPLTGRDLLDMKSLISGMPEDMVQYEKALVALKGREPDATSGSRVRVLLTGVPLPHGAERVIDIIENNGGLVVCQENCTGLKPLLEDVENGSTDPIISIAEKYYHLPCSVMMNNTRRIDHLKELAREYRAECVIELIWQDCITYDVESGLVKKMAEEELDIPYLRIGTDYSPSDTGRIAVRVEALFETVKGR
ncbi:MAG: 2-hydroxyacyl-CoA dehydratase [Candidatus Omnitrophica bacterium]|nr:2-hydroxyacyl-CoA dehydratase [Candidatus Omnitrophota bacterium]